MDIIDRPLAHHRFCPKKFLIVFAITSILYGFCRYAIFPVDSLASPAVAHDCLLAGDNSKTSEKRLLMQFHYPLRLHIKDFDYAPECLDIEIVTDEIQNGCDVAFNILGIIPHRRNWGKSLNSKQAGQLPRRRRLTRQIM
jgi:hypothetical protein